MNILADPSKGVYYMHTYAARSPFTAKIEAVRVSRISPVALSKKK